MFGPAKGRLSQSNEIQFQSFAKIKFPNPSLIYYTHYIPRCLLVKAPVLPAKISSQVLKPDQPETYTGDLNASAVAGAPILGVGALRTGTGIEKDPPKKIEVLMGKHWKIWEENMKIDVAIYSWEHHRRK